MALPTYSRGYTPGAAGAQQPGKYQFTGKNYAIWGEQPGWVYDPYSDSYRADASAQKKYYQDTGIMEPDPKQPGLMEQVLPVAAVAGGSALAKEGGTALVQGAKGLLGMGGEAASTAADAGGSFFNTAGAVPDFGLTDVATGAADAGAGAAGTASTLSAITPYVGLAGAGLGAYGIYNATKARSAKEGAKSGAMSGAGMGLGLGAAAPLIGLGPLGWGAMGLMALGGAGLGGGLGALAHEGTKEKSQRRWGELEAGDQAWEDFKNKSLEYSTSDQSSHWDLGDDKAAAPIDELMMSYGVSKAFGPEWLSIAPDKQRQIVQEMVNKDLFNSKQGEFLVDNQEEARKVKDSVLGAK